MATMLARTKPLVVYALNAGSSSLKVAAFQCAPGIETPLGEHEQSMSAGQLASALDVALESLGAEGVDAPHAIGHRVVHGGPNRWRPSLIDDMVLADIEAASVFAPRHQPASLAAIAGATSAFPGLPQVACFDTGFHHDLPLVARTLPIPGGFSALRRYGFHGLSYEWVVSSLGDALGERSVIAHLGSGASLAAVRDGRCVDTTMGLTPLGGLMMSTRSGDVDPGALVHLMRGLGLDADGLERLVEDESGLLGVSGASSDMRELLQARPHEARSALAVELWCMTVRKHIGALAAVLGGIDSLVFTGGIGVRSAELRAEICVGLEHLGVGTDRVAVHVVASDENRILARHTAAVVGADGS
jgi:acetate kinase